MLWVLRCFASKIAEPNPCSKIVIPSYLFLGLGQLSGHLDTSQISHNFLFFVVRLDWETAGLTSNMGLLANCGLLEWQRLRKNCCSMFVILRGWAVAMLRKSSWGTWLCPLLAWVVGSRELISNALMWVMGDVPRVTYPASMRPVRYGHTKLPNCILPTTCTYQNDPKRVLHTCTPPSNFLWIKPTSVNVIFPQLSLPRGILTRFLNGARTAPPIGVPLAPALRVLPWMSKILVRVTLAYNLQSMSASFRILILESSLFAVFADDACVYEL